MSKEDALIILEAMPEPEFQAFYAKLPGRTRLLVGGGLVDWREVLPSWYIKREEAAEE
jgi:hypothetical protein